MGSGTEIKHDKSDEPNYKITKVRFTDMEEVPMKCSFGPG